jgi:hypothetical protein
MSDQEKAGSTEPTGDKSEPTDDKSEPADDDLGQISRSESDLTVSTGDEKKRSVDDDGEEPPPAKRAYLSERTAADSEPELSASVVPAQTTAALQYFSQGMGTAKSMGTAQASAPGDTETLKVVVPNAKAGYIIGKKGSSIQQIRECSGARVNMSDNQGSGYMGAQGSDRVVSANDLYVRAHMITHSTATGHYNWLASSLPNGARTDQPEVGRDARPRRQHSCCNRAIQYTRERRIDDSNEHT